MNKKLWQKLDKLNREMRLAKQGTERHLDLWWDLEEALVSNTTELLAAACPKCETCEGDGVTYGYDCCALYSPMREWACDDCNGTGLTPSL